MAALATVKTTRISRGAWYSARNFPRLSCLCRRQEMYVQFPLEQEPSLKRLQQ